MASAHGTTNGEWPILDAPKTTDAASFSDNNSASTSARQPNPVAMLRNGGIGSVSGNGNGFTVNTSRPAETLDALDMYEKQYYPSQSKSLSGIALRSFILGQVGTFALVLTGYFVLINPIPFWRIPAFITTLATFHFLEFWTTARYNTHNASISSFLLSQNGSAYTFAHTAALIECLVTNLLRIYGSPLSIGFFSWVPTMSVKVLEWDSKFGVIVGLTLIFVGQFVRSLAMIQAGQSFNHIVQMRKQQTHKLITHGVYSIFRHPSYFGFFWWGLGTQFMLGNTVCFVGYAVVLWLFFNRRIKGEEEYLIKFFGPEYVDYKRRTKVWIPFI